MGLLLFVSAGAAGGFAACCGLGGGGGAGGAAGPFGGEVIFAGVFVVEPGIGCAGRREAGDGFAGCVPAAVAPAGGGGAGGAPDGFAGIFA
jgi:hypothetical protein